MNNNRSRGITFLGLTAIVASFVFIASHYVGAGQNARDLASQANLDMYLELQAIAAERMGEVETVSEDVQGPTARSTASGGSGTPGISIAGYRVLTAGPGPVSIPAAAFDPVDNTSAFSFTNPMGASTSSTLACVKAPVYLPDNVTITEFEAALIDNSATTFLSINLRKRNTFTGNVSLIAALSTLVFPPSLEPLNLSTDFITNGTYSAETEFLFLAVCFQNPDEGLLGARVYFE